MHWIGLGIVLVAILVGVFAWKATRTPSNETAARAADVILPEWAPKNPSPEFLRAAKVLKPLPPEMLQSMGQGSQAGEAMLKRYSTTFPALYEFFGTLTDQQRDRFVSAGEVRVKVKQLTPQQRTALDNWFEEFRKAMKGASLGVDDYKVMLYKAGAAQDLSNVDVGFSTKTAGKGHLVHIWFWVVGPGGQVTDFGTAFAQI